MFGEEMGKDFMQSGIILVNKPVGVSSNTAVNIVKHAVGAKKAGHLGTLDLEGAGLLPVTINSATKLFDIFLQKNKTYQSEFVFGFETDTLDMAGKIIKQKPCDISRVEVEKACKEMIGKSLQMPPIYSAKKVGGKVAYKEALKGNLLELKPKEIEIFDLKVLEQTDKNTFKFEISCSSGTYIRSLCRDLAEKLGIFGTMKNILRTKCGNFDIKDAFTLEQIKAGDFKIIPCGDVLEYPILFFNRSYANKLLNGVVFTMDEVDDLIAHKPDGTYKIICERNILGLAEKSNGKLKMTLRL